MDMEHLATLERLRQSQRQDYLKVVLQTKNHFDQSKLVKLMSMNCFFVSIVLLGFCIWFSAGNRSFDERIT